MRGLKGEPVYSELRKKQSDLVSKRNDLLADLAEMQLDGVDEKFVEDWVLATDQIEEQHAVLVEKCLINCKEIYIK